MCLIFKVVSIITNSFSEMLVTRNLPLENVTTERIDDVLVVSLLNERDVTHSILRTDDANVREVGRRRDAATR